MRRAIAIVVLGSVLAACGDGGGDGGRGGGGESGGTTITTTPEPSGTATSPPSTAGTVDTTSVHTAPAGTTTSWPPAPADCPQFTAASTASDGGPLGVTGDALGEVSGMAVSRTNPGLLWVHNDSGDRARIYLVGEDLEIRTTVDVPEVFALDWEAMSAGPGPGGEPWLWVADSGDNLLVRPFVELHGFPEPILGPDPSPTATAGPVVTLRVRYPAGPLDVEAFAVDPHTGDGFLFGKTLDADGRSDVIWIPATSLREGGEVTADTVGSVVVTNGETGARSADISADGTLVAVKDLTTTSIWLRGPDDDLAALVQAEPAAPCRTEVGRGEALALSADGHQVWTLEEGAGRPLRRFTSA